MKKYLLGLVFLSLISCGNSDDPDNPITNDPLLPKIKTLSIKDEETINGSTTLYENYDYKFEYDQDKLVKVWDTKGNYTENLVYENDLISTITITGNKYVDNGPVSPYTIKRKLYYDNNRRLIKSEPISNTNVYNEYMVFEYPSPDVILVKFFGKNSWNDDIGVQNTHKIYFVNGNVTKVEQYFNESTSTGTYYFTTFEYDNKINPNSLIDRSRILALPRNIYNIYVLQEFAQISKNNVVKKQAYWASPDYGVQPVGWSTDINYTYHSNGLPAVVSHDVPDLPGFKTSATFGF
ncbi:hypothetical protein [Chryseobacterium vrystaatense]|uniref:Uncharacterized protein n=1 Tax=Chryseobacterium vrystaatense TaxID=307480 RepID=A0A1M5BUI2_9FLAO|nr:hypothetical protein [Chryseobacterium vrystaatense]SHF46001.1 hypothetical protein SAMN02787073_2384 [Chryseobacterium vrystaatense]